MKVRELLHSCRGAAFELRSIQKQLDHVKLPLGPSSNSASIVITESKDKDPTTTALNNMDYYEALLEEKRAELNRNLIAFEEMLSSLPDEKTRAIMRYYYCLGWTNVAIADELEISEKTATRKRILAIQTLERKFDVETKCPRMSYVKHGIMIMQKCAH